MISGEKGLTVSAGRIPRCCGDTGLRPTGEAEIDKAGLCRLHFGLKCIEIGSTRLGKGRCRCLIAGPLAILLEVRSCFANNMQDDRKLAIVSPQDYLTFTGGLDLSSTLTITNISSESLQFRLKTNSPAAYSITPASGLLSPSGLITIKVTQTIAMNEGEILSRHRIQVLVQGSNGPEASIALLSVRIEQRTESLSPRRFHTASSGEDYDVMRQATEENQKLVREVAKLRLEVERMEAKPRKGDSGAAWKPVLCFFIGVLVAKVLSSGRILG